MTKQTIAILILAAGKSSRMGEHIKQILPWKATTMLGNALSQAQASIANKVYVVLGAYDEIIKAEVDLAANEIIQNPNWENGLGSSIVCGIDFILEQSERYDAVLIALGDQPLIDANYLNEMIDNWIRNPSKIITTQYENRSGVPAIFGKEYFSELQKLDKDFGAKDIITAHKTNVIALNPDGKEVDIDSLERYNELINSLN